MQKRLLSTRLFTVEQRVCDLPDGRTVSRDIVVHPGAVVILPILDQSRIVMIRNRREAVEQELWELPAGTRSPDESPIDTARRELQEETGYMAGTMTPMMEFFTSPGILTERMHAFVATGLEHVGQKLEAGEQIECHIVKMDDARSMLFDGRLLDGKTIAVLGRYFLEGSTRPGDR